MTGKYIKLHPPAQKKNGIEIVKVREKDAEGRCKGVFHVPEMSLMGHFS